jgi:MerR family transcriptional regulator, light-induced transcriptional regulator
MRDLSPAFGREVEYPADGRRVLLAAPAGEQHTFGMSMVAEFFRRAGWEVVGGVGSLDADPALVAQGEWFDVVGISVGHHVRLEWVKATIAAIRQQSRNKGIGVMVGGPLFVVQPHAAVEGGCRCGGGGWRPGAGLGRGPAGTARDAAVRCGCEVKDRTNR